MCIIAGFDSFKHKNYVEIIQGGSAQNLLIKYVNIA